MRFVSILVTRPGITQESVNTYFRCGPRDRPIGTLRVVTTRELAVLSCPFTSCEGSKWGCFPCPYWSEAIIPRGNVFNKLLHK